MKAIKLKLKKLKQVCLIILLVLQNKHVREQIYLLIHVLYY